ncbi:MFS transporter [Brevibacillus sp. NRS-1366]|uniref:MFS transporter n=1 Tax=Brevibacillus sp. NRS-1366 TaxID=3233899 RepID=UPI003D1BC56C
MKKHVSISAALLFLTLLVEVIGVTGIIMALPMIGVEFQLNSVELGAIVSAYFLGYAVFTIPGGAFADKVGSKRIIAIGLVLWAFFTALTGFVNGFVTLFAVRVLLGIIQAPLSPAILKAVAERTPSQIRTTTNAFVLTADPFGSALTPLIVAPLIVMQGWHNTSIILGALGLLMAPVIWFLLPRPLPPELAQPAVEKVANAPAQQSEQQPSMKLSDVLRNGQIWMLTLIMFGISIVATGFLTWVPTYLTTEKHLDLTQTGFAASLPPLAAMLANIAGGWLFDRYLSNRFHQMVIPSLLLSSLFLILMITSSTVLQFVLYESAAFAFLSMTNQPVIGLTMRIIPAHVLGIGSGILLTGIKTASIITPVLMGAIIAHISFEASFVFLLTGLVLSIAAAIGVRIKPAARCKGTLTGNKLP